MWVKVLDVWDGVLLLDAALALRATLVPVGLQDLLLGELAVPGAFVGDMPASILLPPLVLHDLPKVEPPLRLALRVLLGWHPRRLLQHLVDLLDPAEREAHGRGLVHEEGLHGRVGLLQSDGQVLERLCRAVRCQLRRRLRLIAVDEQPRPLYSVRRVLLVELEGHA